MSGDASSSTFHDFQELIISNYKEFRNSKFQSFKVSKIQRFKDSLDLEKIILFSTHSYYFRLIHGLIASFLAFCSALGSWLMAGSSLVARRSAPVPFPGPGPAKTNQKMFGQNIMRCLDLLKML